MRLTAEIALCLGWAALTWAAEPCPPLPPPSGTTTSVTTVSQLVNAVNSAVPGDTILIADGTYSLDGAYLWVDTPGVTLRSASGNRDAVVLDGNYLTTEIVTVAASDVTIADLTLREPVYHPIHVVSAAGSDTLNTLIYNLHIVNPGQQAIKINPGDVDHFPDDGTIACSHIELTDAGRIEVWDINGSCYTGGVDAHQAWGWTIRDNLIEGFWCPAGLSEHAIHLWRGCRDTVVERNVTRDNARGIGFGLVSSGDARTYPDDPCPGAVYVDHYGGVIRNNFVFASSSGLFDSESGFDCGICLASACGAQVLHNTVASTQAPSASSIEWRFESTDAEITNNLATHNYWQRDGATASLTGNLDSQPLSLFVDGAGGDLHLAATASVAIDQVTAPPEVVDDIDADVRPLGSSSDVGADEHWLGDPIFAGGFESGDAGGWSGTGGGWAVTATAAYVGSYGLEVAIGSCGGDEEVVLSDPPGPGPLSVDACISITAGGGFIVVDGAAVTFTAGRVIGLYDGFAVESGGSFSSVIDPNLDPHGWVQDDSPDSEARYLAEFFIDLDGLTLGVGDELHHFVAYSTAGEAQLRLVIRDGPEVSLEIREDDGGYHSTSPGLPLVPGWNRITLAWEASGSATASLTVNDSATAELVGLDTDGRRIDSVRWGIVGGSLGGSSGTIHQDAFSSWR
jgi:hypothetical protein